MLRISISNKQRLGYVAAFMLSAAAGLYFRLYPVTLNPYTQNKNFARITIYVNLRKNITESAEKNFPALTPVQRSELVDNQFRKILKDEHRDIEKHISQLSKKIAPGLSKFYLSEADPYYYYHLTKKLVREGSISNRIENGRYLDQFMLAPAGEWRKIEIHPFVGFFTYKFLRIFNRHISLVTAVSIVPLILYILCALLFFRLLFFLDIKFHAAAIGGIFFVLSPIFIQRSSFGWYDTDPYNILLPMAAVFTLLLSLKNTRGFIWVYLLAALTALYSVAWQGWFFLPCSIFFVFLIICIQRLIDKKEFLSVLKKLLLYTFALSVFLVITLTPKGFISSARETYQIFSEFVLFNTSTWPDIFLTVGELRVPSFNKLIHILGGSLFLCISVFGLCLLFFKKKPYSKETAIIIAFFYVIFLLMAKSAERFSLLLLTPAALCFPVGMEKIISALKAISIKFITRNTRYAAACAYLSSCLLITVPLLYGHVSASNQDTIYNGVWDRALKQIREMTPVNTIVNSWWPPGHFIKATAERRVTFDGATPNTPQAYWMADFFLSDDEAEALAILRMLNNSGNQAAQFLEKNNLRLDEAVELIKKILVLDKGSAREILYSYLPKDKTDHLLSLTHSQAPPSVCFIYNDLIKGVLGLYYVKEWNFKKASDLKKRRFKELKKGKLFWRGSKDNINLMWDIAGGATYIGEESYQTATVKDVIYFSNGVMLNTSGMEAKISSLNKHLSGIPLSILYVKDGKLYEKHSKNPSVKLSVLFVPKPDGSYSSVIAPSKILRSILFRLYYLDGIGLKNFEKIIQEEDPRLDTKIEVYKINWPG